MRKTILFIIILVFTFLSAQDYNNLYSPWGFNAPFLKSGEFVLTARGYTNWSDSEYFYDNDPDRYSNSESSSLYFYTRAMLALTDKFLINTTLYLYPGRETSRSFSGNTGYDQENWYTLKTYLYPYITLIDRPEKILRYLVQLVTEHMITPQIEFIMTKKPTIMTKRTSILI